MRRPTSCDPRVDKNGVEPEIPAGGRAGQRPRWSVQEWEQGTLCSRVAQKFIHICTLARRCSTAQASEYCSSCEKSTADAQRDQNSFQNSSRTLLLCSSRGRYMLYSNTECSCFCAEVRYRVFLHRCVSLYCRPAICALINY